MARMKVESWPVQGKTRPQPAGPVAGRAARLRATGQPVLQADHLATPCRRRWLSEKVLGLSARRELPKWRADTFWRSVDPAGSEPDDALALPGGGQSGSAVRRPFNGTFEVENALARRPAFQAAATRCTQVTKSKGHFCCGRTYLPAGWSIKPGQGCRLVDELLPLARAGVAVVGLNPRAC